MQVAALGGCGEVGRVAVRAAAGYDFVEGIVIADREVGAASELAARVGPKASAVALDATSDQSLDAAIRGCDVVLNTIGPFHRFGVRVLQAAIRNRVHYLDVNDDWEPTLQMLELGGEAEAAGITAVVGLGASPGITNLLALEAMDGLDGVDRIVTGWSFGDPAGLAAIVGADRREASAAVAHWLHQCSGTIRIVREGRPVDVRPLEEVVIDYPELGVGTAWTVGHPEALTLARARPVRESLTVMAGSRAVVDEVAALAAEIDAGRLHVEEAAHAWAPGRSQRARTGPTPADGVRLPFLFAHAVGRRGGRRVCQAARLRAVPERGLGGTTGVPLACGLVELAKGRLVGRGVFTPEEIVQPATYLGALGARCSPTRTARELVAVTVADDPSGREETGLSPRWTQDGTSDTPEARSHRVEPH